jgi:hypothetical protein
LTFLFDESPHVKHASNQYQQQLGENGHPQNVNEVRISANVNSGFADSEHARKRFARSEILAVSVHDG